jgi:hypothetical protein
MIKVSISGKEAGLFVVFDDCDFDIAHGHLWHLVKKSTVPVGYAQADIYREGVRTTKLASRMVLEKMLGRELETREHAEHKHHHLLDGDKDCLLTTLDNRRLNLRLADQRLNSQNTGKYSNNTTGFKGTYLNKAYGKYYSLLTHYYKGLYGAYTYNKEEAAKSYDCTAHLLFDPDFAVFNFPDESFEEKWERIGERQRRQILHGIERHGFMNERVKILTGV